ncbi:acyl-CoA dehydrogenase family protein [Saccharomonospora sp. NPDC046836]|uniref:acyl-CoA dehydrogenase family protein n=1 Tax=Saccharomonospora sp. NPDC046836 TaxID=3156921 RepID=UPI0034045B41
MLTEPLTDEDTVAIAEVVRRFLTERCPTERVRRLATTDDGYDPADFAEMAEMGWAALALSDEDGGAGYGPPQLAALFEESGRALGSGPLLASAGFALPVLTACDDPVATELVSALATGERIATLVYAPLTVSAGDTLTGTARRVLDGTTADILVVVAGDQVFVVDPGGEGVRIDRSPCADDTRRVAEVRFAGAPATRLDLGSPDRLRRGLSAADIYLAASLVGGAGRALEMTLEYLRTRHQFGKPIGSFQALKHRCADAAVAVSLARELVHGAAALVSDGPIDELTVAATSALVRAAGCAQRMTGEAIQLYGGIGFTDEHDIGLYYRRALADRDLRGPIVERAAELSRALGFS